MPLNDYKLKAIASEFDLTDNNEKTKYIDKALEEITLLKSSYEREIYLKQLSQKTKVDLNTLQKDLQYKLFQKKKEDKKEETPKIVVKDAKTKSEEFILASIIHKKPYAKMVSSELFEKESHRKLYDFILKSQELQKEWKIGDLFTNFESEPELLEIINLNFDLTQNQEDYFNKCVKTLELDNLLKRQQELITKIETTMDAEAKKQLMKDFSLLSKQIMDKRK